MEVVVLNLNYDYLSTISWKRAITLVMSDKAEVLKNSNRIVNSPTEQWFIPAVIRLLRLVRSVYRRSVPLTRNNIFTRDSHTCQYCGSKDKLTLDHIIPKSRNGKQSWENLVVCCIECNVKKGNKTPNEAEMYLKCRPYKPTVMEFILKKIKSRELEKFIQELFQSI